MRDAILVVLGEFLFFLTLLEVRNDTANNFGRNCKYSI